MQRSRSEITAEGFRELDEHRVLLEDIKRVLMDLAEGQLEHRAHTRDNVDRLGTRVLAVEHRTAALEKVTGR